MKIIGLRINEQQGILQSCELRFDESNHLIAVKGEVGSGKTTLQRSLKLGTMGGDTLKDDKQLLKKLGDHVALMEDKNFNETTEFVKLVELLNRHFFKKKVEEIIFLLAFLDSNRPRM